MKDYGLLFVVFDDLLDRVNNIEDMLHTII